MKIAMGADHAGFALKEDLKGFLLGEGHEVEDHGTHSEEPVDYPAFCAAAARAVTAGDADRAIVLGGSGQGEQIAANKVHGIRAALCHDLYLGGEIVTVWLDTPFDAGRHEPRIEQIAAIERGEL